MSPKEIESLIRCGETSLVQFKREMTSPKQIAAEIVAFANTKGGTILFGIQDKTGEFWGLDYKQVQEISMSVGNVATDLVKPSIFLTTETVEINDKLILAVSIPEGKNKPYKDSNGIIWIKQAADKRKLIDNNEILGLFQESQLYQPELAPVPGTSNKDLEVAYLNEYFEKVYGKAKEEFGKPLDQLLKNIGVMTASGELTKVGLLFFARNPQLYLSNFKVKAVAFYGNSIGETEYLDSRDIEGTIPAIYHESLSFLKANLIHKQKGKSFNSTGTLEIPEIVLEELLQNALVHLDLLKPEPIRLLVFSNRIEISNPGTLYGGLTVDDIKLGVSKLRNPTAANFCSKILVYRGLGSGIVRTLREGVIVDFCNDTHANQFKVTLWRTDDKPTINNRKDTKTDDKPTVNCKKDTETDDKPTINGTEHQIMEFIKNNGDVSSKSIAKYIGLSVTQTKEYLYRLVKAGLVISLGANRNKTYRLK